MAFDRTLKKTASEHILLLNCVSQDKYKKVKRLKIAEIRAGIKPLVQSAKKEEKDEKGIHT